MKGRCAGPKEEEFTPEQKKKYGKLAPGMFWGGYANLEDYDGVLLGFIRLYSPQGSAKWCFTVKDGVVGEVDFA